ncbi:MAG: hypothetical protein VX223_18715, partial [Myxococcota bacterium]|nr:hypothetical protein [Myxococcota bacterium]
MSRQRPTLLAVVCIITVGCSDSWDGNPTTGGSDSFDIQVTSDGFQAPDIGDIVFSDTPPIDGGSADCLERADGDPCDDNNVCTVDDSCS